MESDLIPGEDELTDLTPEQERRTAALYQARGIVGAPHEIGAYPPALSPDTIREVVWLAEYILTGEHYPSTPPSISDATVHRFN